MNIYQITWVEHGRYGMAGVVLADNADKAFGEINLDINDITDLEITLLGKCIDENAQPCIIAKESL
jgi:hypothetical protein